MSARAKDGADLAREVIHLQAECARLQNALDGANAALRSEGARACKAEDRAIGWKALAKARALSGVAAMNARRKALALLEAAGVDPEAP